MTPKLCPVCVGRGTVPEDLYCASLPEGWEAGTSPPIREDSPEVECRACEGLGVVWPPSTAASMVEPFDEEGDFTFTTLGSRVCVTTSSVKGIYTDLYDWEEATSTPTPSLSLVRPKAEDDN